MHKNSINSEVNEKKVIGKSRSILEVESDEQSTVEDRIEDLALSEINVSNSHSSYTIAIIPSKIQEHESLNLTLSSLSKTEWKI